jgi:hypothetical protein
VAARVDDRVPSAPIGGHRKAHGNARRRARAGARAGLAMHESELRESSIPHRKERSMMWDDALVRRSKISRYEK